MGMTIEHVNKLLSVIAATITEDDDCFTIEDENLQVFKEALLIAIDTMRKYQMMQADYEARLKADMVAMLEELDLTIDEIPIVTRHGVTRTVMTAQGMRKKIKENIQQKINSLKEPSNDD